MNSAAFEKVFVVIGVVLVAEMAVNITLRELDCRERGGVSMRSLWGNYQCVFLVKPPPR